MKIRENAFMNAYGIKYILNTRACYPNQP